MSKEVTQDKFERMNGLVANHEIEQARQTYLRLIASGNDIKESYFVDDVMTKEHGFTWDAKEDKYVK